MTIAEAVPAEPESAPEPATDLIDYAEAQLLLGGVSHATVYRLATDGEIAMIEIRRVRRFSRRSIAAYLKRQAKKRR